MRAASKNQHVKVEASPLITIKPVLSGGISALSKLPRGI